MDAADLEARLAAFGAARGLFDALVAQLGDPAADELSHAALEERIACAGREVMRQMMQDHLDLRSIREPRRSEVTGSDKVARRRIEPGHERALATVFGTVTVTRIAYRALGASNLHPADATLNLPLERASHGLRRLAAIEAVRGSFDDAKAAIERTSGARIGKRQIEQLTERAAGDIEAFYRARPPVACADEHLLILSFDGKGIVMRPQHLRAATLKAAMAKGGNTMKTRLASGEKNGRKRMAVLAAVYDIEPEPRTAADVIAPANGAQRERRKRPGAVNKWLTGSVTDNAQTVISAAFDQAEARDPDHRRTWIVLLDGANAQIEQIKTEAAVRGVTIHLVCDLIHVLEYLWKAAWCLHQSGDTAAEGFVAEHARTILTDGPEPVIAALRQAAAATALGASKSETIEKACTYLENKSPYLHYATALACGWPIATGVIEGACRHLVKDRLDITGARWSLPGAEAVLKLRALITNGDFEPYYAWHLKREHQRNHQALYQDKLSLAA
ncbi:MAG: ISKra4 family transposase [Solirubrobacteraceae bacterium]